MKNRRGHVTRDIQPDPKYTLGTTSRAFLSSQFSRRDRDDFCQHWPRIATPSSSPPVGSVELKLKSEDIMAAWKFAQYLQRVNIKQLAREIPLVRWSWSTRRNEEEKGEKQRCSQFLEFVSEFFQLFQLRGKTELIKRIPWRIYRRAG